MPHFTMYVFILFPVKAVGNKWRSEVFTFVRIEHFFGFLINTSVEASAAAVVNTLLLRETSIRCIFVPLRSKHFSHFVACRLNHFGKLMQEVVGGGGRRCSSLLLVRRRLSPGAHFLSGAYSAVVTRPQTSIPAASAQSKVHNSELCSLVQGSFMDRLQVSYQTFRSPIGARSSQNGCRGLLL